MNPEAILWTQVLLQAIWDLAGVRINTPPRYLPLLHKSARAWLCSRDESLGSFVWTCNCLSLDPDTVRKHGLSKSPAELSALSESEIRDSLSQPVVSPENPEQPSLNEVAPLSRNAKGTVFFSLHLKNIDCDASAS